MNRDKFWTMVDKTDGCWLWIGSHNSAGYGTLRFGGRVRLAHRISWELTNGAIPSGMCACHKCDTRTCVNPAHLFLGTNAENVADMISKGRKHTGGTKLTEAQVIEIIALQKTGLSPRTVGARFGTGNKNISGIWSGKNWKRFPREEQQNG